MQSMFDERQWLAWLVKVRILILTFLLGIELAIAQLTPSPLPLRLFVEGILLWYGISVFHLLLLSFWEEVRIQSVLQVITDLAFVTLIVHATGGVDSSFNFLYPLVIIVGCILLPKRWAYATATFAFILYGTVLELAYFGEIQSYSLSHPKLKAFQAIIIVNFFAYLAVAYLAGLLVSKLRQVDVRLKHTSGALENLQAVHENIIQSISGGLITTGLDGRITITNIAAQKLLGRSQDELMGKPIQDLFQDALPLCDSQTPHSEVRHSAPNGYRKTFRVMVSELSVPDRGAIGLVYTFDDLTEIRRLEREVRTQDRLAAVGRLAAAIAHEIRNPLTSIAGSVSMLADVPDLNAEHRHLLQIVTRESDRLNNIITDFLSYSRGKHYQFAPVNLVSLLEDTLTLLTHRLVVENRGITVVRNYTCKDAPAVADGDKLKQVFWNFCENAVRAMAQGGKLTVSLEAIGDDWQISFADTGPGISPNVIEKIFEPFQSQFEGGTGLGLAIVYQVVQAHEGKVWARSKPGQGSEFVLRIRRAANDADELQTGMLALKARSVAAGVMESSHG
jgi:two-component system, NtrC family, sensor histidine kinase PilS